MSTQLFKIVRNYSYGWDDLCSDHVDLYFTEADAQAEIDDLIADVKDSVARGFMDQEEDPEDYMVELVTDKTTAICAKCGTTEDDSQSDDPIGYCVNGHDAWLEGGDEPSWFAQASKQLGIPVKELEDRLINTRGDELRYEIKENEA